MDTHSTLWGPTSGVALIEYFPKMLGLLNISSLDIVLLIANLCCRNSLRIFERIQSFTVISVTDLRLFNM